MTAHFRNRYISGVRRYFWAPKGEGRGVGFQKPSPLGEGVTRSVTDEVSGQRPPAGAHSAPLQISRNALAFLQGRPYVAARKPSPQRGEGGTAKP